MPDSDRLARKKKPGLAGGAGTPPPVAGFDNLRDLAGMKICKDCNAGAGKMRIGWGYVETGHAGLEFAGLCRLGDPRNGIRRFRKDEGLVGAALAAPERWSRRVWSQIFWRLAGRMGDLRKRVGT